MLFFSLILSILFSSLIFVLIFRKLKKANENSKIRKFFNLKFTGTHIRTKKIGALFLLFLMGGAILFACYNICNRIAFTRLGVSGYYEWRETNDQKYLYVEADNHYDLGYQTGYALSCEIVKLKYLIILASNSYDITLAEIESLSKKYLKYIPDKYQSEMRGMSDGASAGSGFYISFTDILFQNLFFEILYGQKQPNLEELNADYGCTDLGSKNADGSIIAGQSMDLAKPIGWTQSFVLHKLPNQPLVFTHRIGGSLAMPMGKNEDGLMIIMNLVQTKKVAPITTPMSILVREGLENEKNVEGFFEALFPKNKSPYSLNYILCNKTSLLAIQSLPEVQASSFPNTTIVHTNRYLNHDWENMLMDPDYSKDRQEYAEKLLEKAYSDNKTTNKELLKILADEPIICRNEEGLFGTKTVSFMTIDSFGIGTPNGKIGKLPL